MSPYLKPLKRILVVTSTYENFSNFYSQLLEDNMIDLGKLEDHYISNYFQLLTFLISQQTSIICSVSHQGLFEINETPKFFIKSCNIFFQKIVCFEKPNKWVTKNFQGVNYIKHNL